MAGELYYTIADAVFEKYPGYVRGVVLGYGVKNGESPAGLVAMLRQAESGLRAMLSIDHIIEHPRISSWREAYRAFGAKPSEFRPSMEAMARRVLRGQELPQINALVDIGNLISLRHLTPVGGHAIDHLKKDIALRPASGEEVFIPFDSEEKEHPLPGEIVFVEGNVVLTRRWTWRQSSWTLTLPSTTAIEFNVDGLLPVSISEVEAICEEVMALVGRYCGGRLRYDILSKENPKIRVTE